MDTQDSPLPPENDFRPLDQQDRAAAAKPNPNDPIINASSPNYGSFGGVDPDNANANDGPAITSASASQQAGRSGSNDNPDEFSEFNDREKDARDAPANPEDQPGHITQNQAPELVREVEATSEDNEELRKAWSIDDPRYAGGGTHNTREESASTKDSQD